MANLKDFIKTLNILYVEDESSAREIFTTVLKKIFNTVDAKENGLDGYFIFKEKYLNNERYDLVISDINMPKLDGMEMLGKIRELDTEVPVIFITARQESDILLKAIELQISDFIVKPLSIDTITKVIDKASEKLFLKNILMKKNLELELYLKTIEQIAFIIKMDSNFNINYINKLLCDSINCEANDIIGQNFDLIKSKISTYNVFEKLKETLSNNQIWEDIIKIEKDENESIYLKAKIIPTDSNLNENIKDYIFIAYTVTNQENEKKELNKKMFKNIAFLKKEFHNNLLENKKLQEEIVTLKNYITKLDEQIIDANKSKANLLDQLESYEISSLNQSTRKVDVLRKKNEEIDFLRRSIQKLRVEKDLLTDEINNQRNTIVHRDNLVEIFKKNELELNKKIENLRNVISYLEVQNGKGKVKKSLFMNLNKF